MAGQQTPLRLFQNPWLERLTVISPTGFMALWMVLLPAIVWLSWETAEAGPALALVLAGWLFWSLTEYSLHRHVFHWQPRWEPLKSAVFIVHGNHHAVPNDPLRNLMPPIVSLPVSAVIWGAWYLIIGEAAGWFMLGFLMGYVGYDLVHYACHQLPMKGRFARIFKQHHMRHHHAQEGGNYAITGMMWDRLFGTLITSLKR